MQTTPHNEARPGDYAAAVLLPGDPQRAEWIAATFLDETKCVNRVRGALGYTGRYRGVPVSVQTTGIGAPSLAIYVHELIVTFGATTLIRVGTCGALAGHVKLRSLVISQSSSSDGRVDHHLAGDREPRANLQLLQSAARLAGELRLDHHIGVTVSNDVFYHPDLLGCLAGIKANGALAVDMETSALYTVAARLGAKALSICTVVDHVVTAEKIDAEERQAVFADMSRLALDVAIATSSEGDVAPS